MTSALEGGDWSAARPGRTLPPVKTRYPLYRRLGGPQGRSGQVRKISPPPVFDPRTVLPVVSHYTDWATRPTRTSVLYMYVYIFAIFQNAVSNSGCMVLKDKMTSNNELECMWKDVVEKALYYSYFIWTEALRKTTKNLGIFCIPIAIRTEYLSNVSNTDAIAIKIRMNQEY
jgi:hypothetical protein